MRRGRVRARRAIVSLVLLAAVVAGGRARAANIQLHASRDCVDRADIADQVDALLGHPVAEVQGLDFDVDIAERPEHRWRLRLITIGRADGARRSREIDGSGCTQLADAAAVAIAMSIQSREVVRPAPVEAPPPPNPEPPKLAAAGPAPPERSHDLRLPIAVSALADVGALPHPGWGLG